MQIVIDISKEKYDEIMSMDWVNCRRFFDEELRAIHDGNVLEPSGDCINRKAAIDAIWDGTNMDIYTREVKECLEALPPVTSAKKMGHWITLKDEYDDVTEAVCSCCDKNGNHKWAFCPNCGAKMQEVEE